MSREKYITQWTDGYNEQMKTRLEKREELIKSGKLAYKNNLKPSITGKELKEKYDHLAKEEIGETESYAIAGRILLARDFGKAAFLQIDDGSTRFQVYVKKNVVSEDGFQEYKLADYGDVIFAKGDIFKTNKGELSLNAHEFAILSKSLRPLPEKFHGLTDPELRYRLRYVDLIMNPESRERLRLRSQIVRHIREFFYQKDFLEVETPMMHSIAGGAAAKPFKTHHNALGMDLYLRIAPELHLKRLIVGGYNRVFEMNRCFRNEGLSIKHNPEFTSVEFYQAYATYEDMMDFTEELISSIVEKVLKTDRVTYGENEILFGKPFARITLNNSLLEVGGMTTEEIEDRDHMINLLASKGLDKNKIKDESLEKLRVLCFEELVEGKLIQPTFITQYPTEVSPLSRKNDEDPTYVDRFELFMNGWEIANAFSELNNPSDQLERFADQAMLKEGGDDEACDPDYDYVRALEYGMAPTAGEGIGIDRLVMILTGSSSIRDVLFFPLLKRETFFEEDE